MRDESTAPLVAEAAVYDRYAAAAQAVEPALCCPVSYTADYLRAIPQEILERDYGCGDPTPYAQAGETVLDLGSGGGKLCYILAQVVGAEGKVIGVDCNEEMLALARKYQAEVAARLGYSNVDFRYGVIQDLALDVTQLTQYLAANPVRSPSDWLAVRQWEERQRRQRPLIPDNSVDCVVSNCVLNLVRQQDRTQLFQEIFRVLKPHGRAAISDIVSDADVPEAMQNDATLWSGCISGAYREDRFMDAFAAAGFHGMQLGKRQNEPWQTVQGIAFRSVTVLAFKPGSRVSGSGSDVRPTCAVIYRGPFRQIELDHGVVLHRGVVTRVSAELRDVLARAPYAGHVELLDTDQAPAISQGLNVLPLSSGCCSGDSCC